MSLLKIKKIILFISIIFSVLYSEASRLLIPMDKPQSNHLKAYGIAYWILTQDIEVSWLLNYQGGSFLCNYSEKIANECALRGVSYKVLADVQAETILAEIAQADVNMSEIKLNKAPKLRFILLKANCLGMMPLLWFSLMPKFLTMCFMTRKL